MSKGFLNNGLTTSEEDYYYKQVLINVIISLEYIKDGTFTIDEYIKQLEDRIYN